MTISVLLSCVIGIDVAAFLIYNRDLFKGRSKPYRGTWGVWLLIAFLNSASYFGTSGDFMKSFLSFENVSACAVTFTFACIHGGRRPLDREEKYSVVIGVCAGIVWWLFRNAFYANAIMQLNTVVSFIPLWIGLWHDSKSQRPLPWALWSISYALNIGVVMLRWNDQWEDLLYPICYVFFHVGTYVLTLRKHSS